MFRRAVAAAAMALVLAATAGCAGSPAPVGTTPAALSEEEAFARAEETYRAYVDALNQVDLSNPETFEPVYALTTGDANAGLRKEFTQGHADGWTLVGDSKATLITRSSSAAGSMRLAVCLDVSGVSVLDESGQSVVTPERRPVQPMSIEFDASSGKIASISDREGDPPCVG